MGILSEFEAVQLERRAALRLPKNPGFLYPPSAFEIGGEFEAVDRGTFGLDRAATLAAESKYAPVLGISFHKTGLPLDDSSIPPGPDPGYLYPSAITFPFPEDDDPQRLLRRLQPRQFAPIQRQIDNLNLYQDDYLAQLATSLQLCRERQERREVLAAHGMLGQSHEKPHYSEKSKFNCAEIIKEGKAHGF